RFGAPVYAVPGVGTIRAVIAGAVAQQQVCGPNGIRLYALVQVSTERAAAAATRRRMQYMRSVNASIPRPTLAQSAVCQGENGSRPCHSAATTPDIKTSDVHCASE